VFATARLSALSAHITPERLRLTRRTRSPCACRRNSSRGRCGRAGRCTGRDSRRTQGALDADLACVVCRVPERGRARQCARASSLLRATHRGAERAQARCRGVFQLTPLFNFSASYFPRLDGAACTLAVPVARVNAQTTLRILPRPGSRHRRVDLVDTLTRSHCSLRAALWPRAQRNRVTFGLPKMRLVIDTELHSLDTASSVWERAVPKPHHPPVHHSDLVLPERKRKNASAGHVSSQPPRLGSTHG
jgi:hypothetical protein